MELKGSKTEQNLWAAFAGESQAHTKYQYFASQAKKDGFVQIQNIFTETAKNEKEHAKIWFKLVNGGKVPSTPDNLKAAAAGEHEEWTEMYKEFARVAREEGFEDLAEKFEGVAEVEHAHEDRYNKLKANLDNGTVFNKGETKVWHCRNCGYIYEGEEAPAVCPVCNHPQAYFELEQDNF